MIKRKLQVFVSSTFSDMLEERQAAVETILRAGHIPAGMELFTAGDQSQMTVIKRWIDESDVYMLILGARYGSVEPVSGISYTELEYDYAVEQGKPLFAVVIEEKAIDAKVSRLGKDALELRHGPALEQFRRKVLTKMSAFYSEPKDVRLAIFHALPEFAADQNLKGWVWGGDVKDTAAIEAEMRSLREENAALKAIAPPLTQKEKKAVPADNLLQTIELLGQISVTVPAAFTKDKKDSDVTLLNIVKQARDTLVAGVTNRADMNEYQQFLYFNIFPKLQVHGMAQNDSVAGVRYRRSYLNARGHAVLAELDRMALKGRSAKKSPAPKVSSQK